MNNINYPHDMRHIKICMWIIITSLFLSGVTAFPIETELGLLIRHDTVYPDVMRTWLHIIHHAISVTNQTFPNLSYGTDWLAFAHIILAILFVGPLRDPVKNKWVIEFGMIACIAIFPLAFIAGGIRGIPVFWRLIDCSFGVFGIIPLIIAYRTVGKIEREIE